jgi:glycosyltransferase involved in cell wall biosynthesis
MVGTLEPRKGHAQALDAFEVLWRDGQDIALVIVGKKGWRIDDLAARIRNHSEFGRRLIWLEEISDEFLDHIYKSATFLLGASEGEGFGLPLIEAARHGLPLIVRDLAVFHEVVGNGALFFPNRRDPAAISNSIKNWIELKKEDAHPKPSAVQWLTWSESAAMLVQVLLDATGTESNF